MTTEVLTKAKIAYRQVGRTEPEWLYDMRKRAWEFYQDEALPLRIIHLWKYTKPEWMYYQSFQLLSRSVTNDELGVPDACVEDIGRVGDICLLEHS